MTDGLNRWLSHSGMGKIQETSALGGGCINKTSVLKLSSGKKLIAKQHPHPPSNMFPSEAIGLSALSKETSLRIPKVIHVEESFLLLEDLGQGRPLSNFWQQLALGLAELHSMPKPEYGFTMDNYCGSSAQINTRTEDGFQFFSEFRIINMARQCLDKHLLSADTMNHLEYVGSSLTDWIPKQKPVLIHGDLWSGNVHCDENGDPALIDPASYWGWAEAELAMTLLFGGFPEDFYGCYEEHGNMDTQWRERADLYNLYHLLNHLLLFGESYLGQIESTLNRFAPRH